ncbi:MAG: 2,3-bisphosphoglycerate-independent phosphoglycerate mutase [Candidatus Diapherotrites archaeon]
MKPVVLVVMDGFGIGKKGKYNAIENADTKNFDYFWKNYPHSKLKAHGEFVGLPKGYQGSSEVGHLNIGAGRVVLQSLARINEEIRKKKFFKNKAFLKAIRNCKKKKSKLHLTGLVQDEGVHSHQEHLFSLLELCRKEKFKDVKIHFFADGRDTPPKSALKFLKSLEKKMKKTGIGEIATVSGRYYAMDRDNRWKRIEKAYDAIAKGEGIKSKTAELAIKNAYKRKETDEFVLPSVIGNYTGVCDDDSVIFFNYRADRARQITKAFVENNFKEFKRKKLKITYVCMTQYYKDVNAEIAYPERVIKNCLGEFLSKKKIKQLRISETEKYAHVTYFFNAEIEKPFTGETRILIPSPKVATYDLEPEMRALDIANTLVTELKTEKYGFVVCNLVNCDMVGHTGKMSAILKGVEAVDKAIGIIWRGVEECDGTLILTADHGNAEYVHGESETAHTKNDVPFVIISDDKKLRKCRVKSGALRDIAPTILKIMNLKKPAEMTGKSLIH